VRKAFEIGGILLLALGLCGSRALADEMTPEAQKKLIMEGAMLHDQGNYDAALAKYRQVLAANPGNVEALYETTLTLSAKQDWKRCYELAEGALAAESPYKALLYANAGNCRDGAGEADKAIALYERGLREFPNESVLTYNLGIAYIGKRELAKAREMLERTVTLKPDYGSANFALAKVYEDGGQRVPALFTYLRYLSLDSGSQRAKAAAESVRSLLKQGVSTEGSGNVTISISNPDKDSGLSALDLTLSLLAASSHLDKNKGKPEIQLTVETLDSLFAVAGEAKIDQKDCFVCRHYLPFFLDLRKQSLVEPFTYVALASLDLPGTSSWLDDKANAAKMQALGKWSASKAADGKR
jgi:tetratricopeptide (TPR) repeat protein